MNSLVVLFALVAAAFAAPSAEKRSVIAYSVPAAVSHQSRVDVHSSPEVAYAPVEVASVVAEPVVQTVVGPAVYSGASAVSHQSRVDVHHSPAVITEQVVPAVLEARSVYSPVSNVYTGGSAVTHQSRVDVHSAPAVVSEQVLSPVYEARSVYAPSVYTSYW